MATPRNQSVFKAFSMLKCFSSPDEWLTSSELSRRANLPEASGYRMIQTLKEIGAVVRGPHGRYRPGMLLVSLSQNVAIRDLFHEASEDIAIEMSQRLDVTVHVGLLEDGMVYYVTRAFTPTSFPSHARRGCQLEAYCSGLGKVLLAALPQDQLDRFIIDDDFVAMTPYTITNRTALRATLDEVCRRGFAFDWLETREDMICIAVPVFDRHGHTVAAISTTEYAERVTPERQTELLEALMVASGNLTRKVFPATPDVYQIAPKHHSQHARQALEAGAAEICT